MVLKLKQIFDIVGEQQPINYNIELDYLKPFESYSFISPIAINGTLVNRAGVVTLDFSVTFTMKLNCDRCLCEFEREYNYDFSHILVRNLNNDDNDEFIACPDNTLDLNELAVSDIILQLPSKILCKEDCKGLCYVCGNNNNLAECNCNKN